jgi:ADP-heptose:LPS heptosyltransferase
MTPAARTPQVIHMGFSRRLIFRALALVSLLARAGRRSRTVPISAEERRITIIEPFGLGDVLSHEPLVRELQAAGWRITMCGPRPWRELLPAVDWVHSDVPWGNHAWSDKYTVSEYLGPPFRAFLKTLRAAAEGSIGIDTRGDVRSVLLLKLAGCREVISVSRYLGTDLELPRFVGTLVEFSPSLRRWELNLRCLKPLGLEPRDVLAPRLKSPARTEPRLPPRIGLMPVAPWPGKWWQPEKWANLVSALRERGYEATALCGPAQSALASTQLGCEICIHECHSVPEWSHQLAQLDLLVTLDSGPMHLAEAMGTPVVALFGQGLLPLWAPSHSNSELVTHQDDPDFKVCLPSEANTARGQEFMRRISAEEVLGAIERVLSRLR